MSDSATVEILKHAILLEKRGQAFYRNAAAQSRNEAVQAFFSQMADEEQGHLELLSEHYRAFQKEKKWKPIDVSADSQSRFAEAAIGDDLHQRVAAADFEAAAISAAMHMEKQAIELYRNRADSAVEEDEKNLFNWLAEWESHHYDFLAKIDRRLTEKIWHDNGFWPF